MLFKEIIGQQAIKQRLIKSVKENRVSHAQLFLGPEGSGNLALAVAYIQYLYCDNRTEEDACGTCPACIKINKLIHPDLHFLYPQVVKKDDEKVRQSFLANWREAFSENPYLNLNQWYEKMGIENKQGSISVEDSAEILRKLSLKTYESEYKAVVIWMPEKIHPTAANKMLKILEEPPSKTLFLLVAENQDQLLPTVLSRTQLIKINKLTDEDILNTLLNQHAAPYQQAKNIVHLADGNYNEALSLLHQENDENYIGTESFIKWMRMCFSYQKKVGELVSWCEEISKKEVGREKQKNFLQYALHLIRECLLTNYADSALVKLDEQEKEFAQKFAPFVHHGNYEQFVKELNDAYFHIERNAYPKILFLDLSFKIGKLLQMKA